MTSTLSCFGMGPCFSRRATYSDIADRSEQHEISFQIFSVIDHVKNDADAAIIRRRVEQEILHDACTVEEYTRGASVQQKTVADLQKGILRYLQTKDKYTSLGSMLLKSQAFHLVYGNRSVEQDNHGNNGDDNGNGNGNDDHNKTPDAPSQSLRVVNLPRTRYKKPYIPSKPGTSYDGEFPVESLYPFSVSHQMPFVGIARYNTTQATPHAMIGLDVVAFDAYNPKLYNNEQEFIDIFHESFTQWELSRINMDMDGVTSSSRLYELYVRWSMKEAYTKALGVGMGLGFSSFDIRLEKFDTMDESGGSFPTPTDPAVWPFIETSGRTGIWSRAQIIHREKSSGGDDASNRIENWSIFFLALPEKSDEDAAAIQAVDISETQITEYHGCACICVGPEDTDSNSSSNDNDDGSHYGHDDEEGDRIVRRPADKDGDMDGIEHKDGMLVQNPPLGFPHVDIRWTTLDGIIRWHQCI